MLSLKSGSWFIVFTLVALTACGSSDDGSGGHALELGDDSLEQDGNADPGVTIDGKGLGLGLAGAGGSEEEPVEEEEQVENISDPEDGVEDEPLESVDPGPEETEQDPDPIDPVSDAGVEDPDADPEDPEDPVVDAGTPEEDPRDQLECIRDEDCDDGNVCTEEYCDTSTHECVSITHRTEGNSCVDPNGDYDVYGGANAEGVCRSGVCCGGCWDEVLGCMHTRLSDDADFCGVGGVDCQACGGDTPACFIGRCQ